MKKMLWNLKSWISLAVATTAVVACTTKDRDVSFQQGQGQDLEKISDYDGKTYQLQTLDVQTSTSDVQNVQPKTTSVSAKSEKIQKLPLVNYKTDAKLLGDVLFRGRPNHKYVIEYRVTEKYLKVFKVAPAEDIDLEEQTYAETRKDGRLAVPMVGYPVKGFYNVHRLKNGDNEDTNKLGEFSESRANASQFKIDYNGRTIFEALEKENVLPAHYFKGEWFYSATLIAAPEEKKDVIGFDLGQDQNFNPASRIRFSLNETLLKILNINVDDRLDKKDDINLSTALAIPIQWKQYEAVKEGKDKGLSETEVKGRAWDQKKYIQLDLDDVVGAGDFNVAATAFRGAKLVDLEVTDNYFAFVVHQHDSNIRMRYSFMRAEKRDYQAKVQFDDDFQKFGFFTTQKAVANNFEIRRKEDREKNVFISRFNPKKNIVFHYTKSTPKWIRPAATKAALTWNEAFRKAGTNIQVILDESKDAELGDIRYNTINLIESLSEGSLFGFGPSVTDSYTGEIISATTNVHITPIRSALVDEIRNYIRSEMGELQDKYVSGLSALSVRGLNEMIKETKMPDGSITMTVDSDTVSNVKIPLTLDGQKKNIEFKQTVSRLSREKDLAVTSRNIHKEIKNQCPEVQSLIAERKATSQVDSDKELQVLDECSRKLVLHKMAGTLIHEMGHNFGLRHNFMASNDVKNFWTKEQTQTDEVVRSSSVMEYPAFNEDRLTSPGQYDIAAIRYGYADAVETKDGKIIQLDTKKTIQSQVSDLRSFKFCTDDDVALSLDPMCQRHDAGTTPLEVVSNMVLEYNTSVALLNHRYDNLNSIDPLLLGLHRMRRFYLPMKRFYEEWRMSLSRFLGANKMYLEGMTKEQYAEALQKMEKDPVYGPIYNEYHPVADKIFDFLRTVATLPNRYCVTTNSEGKIDLFELDTLRDQIFFAKGSSAVSCTDSSVKNLLKAEHNVDVRTEYGYFLKSIRFDLSPRKITEGFDTIGTEYDRIFTGISLGSRLTLGAPAIVRNFAPSLMDEPQYRETWLSTLESRVLAGLDIRGIAKALKTDDKAFVEPFLPRFKQESGLIITQMANALQGLDVPGNAVESSVRQARYQSTITNNPTVAKQALAAVSMDGVNNFLVFDESAVFARNLIAKTNEIRAVRALGPVDSKEIETVRNLVASIFGQDTLTAGLKMSALLELTEKLQALELESQSTISVVLIALRGEMALANSVTAFLEKASDEEKAAFLGQDLATTIKEIAKVDFALTGSEFLKRAQIIEARMMADKAKYQANIADKEAQSTLLLQTMRLISQ